MSDFFVSCDWGTTHLRLRLLATGSLQPAAELSSNLGVAPIAAAGPHDQRPARFRQALADQLERLAATTSVDWDEAPIVISGMASASIGWHELAYAQVPWRLDGSSALAHELDPLERSQGRHRVLLLSGLRTATDVMRGEETQVLGLFQLESLRQLKDNCIIVLPGTHSKHVQVKVGSIIDFCTYMTGELFDVLGRHSILRHSVSSEGDAFSEHIDSFLEGVALSREMPLAAALFRVRTRQVLDARPPLENRAFLSGLLIGGELVELSRHEPATRPIVLCAAGTLGVAYLRAAQSLGLSDRLRTVADADVQRLASAGQACVARRLALI